MCNPAQDSQLELSKCLQFVVSMPIFSRVVNTKQQDVGHELLVGCLTHHIPGTYLSMSGLLMMGSLAAWSILCETSYAWYHGDIMNINLLATAQV